MDNINVWKKVLNNKEEVKYSFSIGKKYLKFHLIVWGIVCLPFTMFYGSGLVVYLFFLFYYGFYLKAANSYAFTDKRILIHTGLFSTHVISVDYVNITDIRVGEPFFESVFTKTGYLAINTAGSNHLEVVLRHVERPYELKKKLDEIRG